jgi:hypothetical protein
MISKIVNEFFRSLSREDKMGWAGYLVFAIIFIAMLYGLVPDACVKWDTCS